jgi:hypothetical protein
MPETARFEGLRYQRFTILREVEPRIDSYNKKKIMLLARCDCGNERTVQLSNLKTGNTHSCGCRRREFIAEANAAKAVPQKWTIEGDIAWLEVSGRRAIIDSQDVPIAEQYRWHLNGGYFDNNLHNTTLHRVLLGLSYGDKREGDHKNHDTLDNRRSCSIRIATSSQNKMNRRGNKNRLGPYKGVSFDKSRNKFHAQIKINGKCTHIGRFVSEVNAAQAYNILAEMHFGEFAYLNKAEAR